MSKNYYKAAIIIYAIQLLLLTVLLNNMMMDRFEYYQSLQMEIIEMFLGLALFILNIGAIFVIQNLFMSSIKSQRFKIDSLKFKHIEEQNRIYRQHRHDLNNHLSIISGLAELGELDRLRNYLGSYVDNFNKSIVSVDTGLAELDVLLYAKISEAQSKGIDVSFKCSAIVSCKQSKIISLVTIFANALDNAIEACERVKQTKQIDINLTSDPIDYVLTISNTYDQSINLEDNMKIDGFSSKGKDRQGEGLGIIKKNVRGFEGDYQIDIVDGRFKFLIELPKHRLEE